MGYRLKELWLQLQKGILQMFHANIINKVVGMCGNMVITRVLTQKEYGLWSYVLNIYSYLGLVTGLGLLSGAFQFGAENQGTEKEYQYYQFCLYTGMLFNIGLVAIFMVGAFFAPLSFEGAKEYLCLYAPMLLLEYVMNLLITVLRCENRISEYAKILNRNTALLAVGTCAGAFGGVAGVIAGKYIAYVLSLLQVLRYTRAERRRIREAERLPLRKTGALWHYSIFTGISSTLNLVVYLLDVSMIAALVKDPAEVALYKVATLIPSALSFIPGSVVAAVLPSIVRNQENKEWLKKNIRKGFLGLGALNLAVCGGLLILAPQVISILSGKEYLPAVPALRILVCGYFVSGTFKTFSTNILAGLHSVNYNLFTSLATGLMDIGLNYFLIRKYGMIGAAYATFLVLTAASMLTLPFLYKKIYNRRPC